MLFIGTAGFSYNDWINIFYPSKNEKLRYYSMFFNIIEINSSFYTIPDIKIAKNLLNQVKENINFKFILKVNKIFTHNRNYNKEQLIKFKLFCNAFNEKLQTLLFQFPYSFKYTINSLNFLQKIINDFKEFKMAFEFRNKSFVNENFLNFLSQNLISFVNIDQPCISFSTPFTNIVTNTEQSYFRFHGKNYKNWFNDNIKPYERYNYLYSFKNIKFFYYKIKEVETKTKNIIIIMNNHYKAKAVMNAFEFNLLFDENRFSNSLDKLNEKFKKEILNHIKNTT